MKRFFSILFSLALFNLASAQPARLILEQEEGRITFAVDEVVAAQDHCGWQRTGAKIAEGLNWDWTGAWNDDWKPEVLACSFADADRLYDIGEDVVFQMLLKAWCQHRPVVLSPDAIWLVISQTFSHQVNENPEKYRKYLVNHEGKIELKVDTGDLMSDQADWAGLMASFTSEIAKFTNNDIATTLVADFSTTGPDELIASEVTLMNVVKSYFDYTAIYAVCGIPSITLTGTPDDWRKVIEKTRSLEAFGFGWWTADLVPILEEFVKASEGNPDYWFWKDIVKKSRPRSIQGPSCMGRVKLTKFDGWFLKFFPFDNDGRTPDKVTLTQTMLPETVVVPFNYRVVTPGGRVLSETPLELVAGIVAVEEDPGTMAMTPKIGWFVRTAKAPENEQLSRADAIAAEIRNPKSDYVVVICHRGDWRNYPENSIPSIESIIRMGADMMELDLKKTSDGVLVLSHDGDVRRCTNFDQVFGDEPGKSPRISDLTFDEIRRLSLKTGGGEVIDTLRMPTLREALECSKDRICVNVDQGFDFYDEVLAIAEELGVTDQLIIKSGNPIDVVEKRMAPYEHNILYMPVVGIQGQSGRELFDDYMLRGVVPPAYELCWGSNEDGAFAQAAAKVLAQGSKIWVNTIWGSLCGGEGNDDDAADAAGDPGEVYQQYIDAGVSMIQTDRPELLIGWLTRIGRHSLKN